MKKNICVLALLVLVSCGKDGASGLNGKDGMSMRMVPCFKLNGSSELVKARKEAALEADRGDIEGTTSSSVKDEDKMYCSAIGSDAYDHENKLIEKVNAPYEDGEYYHQGDRIVKDASYTSTNTGHAIYITCGVNVKTDVVTCERR